MSARSIARGAAVVGAGVLATAAITAVVIAPTAQSETLPAETVVAKVSTPASASTPVVTAAAADRAAAAERASRAASARQAIAARQARFVSFSLHSEQTKDMRGVEKSLYRGKFYNARSEEKRLCIVKRESEGFYDVVNPTGSYFGAYQVSKALAEGATYMMVKEHKALMGEQTAKKVLTTLRSKPMNTWPRYWQDAAFHTVMNWERPLSGASHWAGGRWHC